MLDSFYMRRTYVEYLVLSKERLTVVNQEIINDDTRTTVERVFGSDRPSFTALDDNLDLKRKLPEIMCFAWLSSKPVSESEEDSYLILVWFQKESDNPFDMLTKKLIKVDWEKYAEGYGF